MTPEEVWKQLKQMRPRRAADEHGIVVEFLREGSNTLIGMFADIFTAVLNPLETIPRILFKKGDERLPENYRLHLYYTHPVQAVQSDCMWQGQGKTGSRTI